MPLPMRMTPHPLRPNVRRCPGTDLSSGASPPAPARERPAGSDRPRELAPPEPRSHSNWLVAPWPRCGGPSEAHALSVETSARGPRSRWVAARYSVPCAPARGSRQEGCREGIRGATDGSGDPSSPPTWPLRRDRTLASEQGSRGGAGFLIVRPFGPTLALKTACASPATRGDAGEGGRNATALLPSVC